MKKSKMMLGSAIMLAVLLVAGGTLAWFTASTEAVVNEFTAGTLEIELIDIFEKVTNLNPGDCYDKEVSVKNIGSKKAMVRIHESTVFRGLDPSFTPDMNVVMYDLNSNWEYDATTNHFYYKEVLEPGDTTDALLVDNKICFDGPSMGNEYQGAKFDIILEADAIQATNGAPTDQNWKFDPLKPVTP